MYRSCIAILLYSLERELKTQADNEKGGGHEGWPILEITIFGNVWHTSACYFRTFTEIRGPVRTSLSRGHRPSVAPHFKNPQKWKPRERCREGPLSTFLFFSAFPPLLLLSNLSQLIRFFSIFRSVDRRATRKMEEYGEQLLECILVENLPIIFEQFEIIKLNISYKHIFN